MTERPYLVYLRLAENIICLFCKAITITVLSTVVYRCFVKRQILKIQLSNTMRTLVWCHWLNCMFTYSYHVYCVVFWRGQFTTYDPYALFFTGLGIDIYFAVSPIPLFFLSIDRCLIMHKNYAYDHHRQRTLFIIELTALVLSIFVEVVMALAELPFDGATASQCKHVVCFMNIHRRLYVTWLKSTFGVLSLLGSVFFLILLNVHRNTATVKDRMIKITIIMELAFCVIPGLAALLWGMVFMENLSNYLGEHATMFLSIDGAVFSVVFHRIVFRKKVQTVLSFSVMANGNQTASVATCR